MRQQVEGPVQLAIAYSAPTLSEPTPPETTLARLEGEDAETARRLHSAGARISAVIPTLNEAANLPHVLARIPAYVDEVVLVDGHSVDNTIEVARAIRPDIRVVIQDAHGKGNALACGFAASNGDIIVMLDADGSTDPAEIGRFVAPLLDGHDFVKGSRFVKGGGSEDITGMRSLGNRGLLLIMNLLYGTRYSDLCYGYNAFWRRCLPHMSVDCNGFEVETLITTRVARAGLSVAEVPSIEYARLHGVSNLKAVPDGIKVLRTIFGERFRRSSTSRRRDPNAWRPTFDEFPRQTSSEVLATRTTEHLSGARRGVKAV